jgi:transposase
MEGMEEHEKNLFWERGPLRIPEGSTKESFNPQTKPPLPTTAISHTLESSFNQTQDSSISERSNKESSNQQAKSSFASTAITNTLDDPTEDRKYTCSNCQEQGHPKNRCPELYPELYMRLPCGCTSSNHESRTCNIVRAEMSNQKSPRRNPGKGLTEEEIAMVLRVYYANKAESVVKAIVTTNVSKRTAFYCGISNKTVKKLVEDFEKNQKIPVRNDKRGKHTRYLERHSPKLWMNVIENLVNNFNKQGETVNVRKLQKKLNGIMKEGDVAITRQTLTRLLHLMGFKFDKVNKTRNFQETELIRLWRMSYLRERLRINREQPDTLLLYLDESYCNQHYVGGKTWYRAGDLVRRGKRGRRWIILHCGGKEGWIGDPLLFEAKSKSGDYHRNMNAHNFEKYFRELCEHTKAYLKNKQEDRPVVFVMDNAAYHKRVEGLKGGIHKLKKADLVAWMEECKATEDNG